MSNPSSISSLDSMAWRCLRTKPKSEHVAAQAIRGIFGIETYCPQIRHQKSTRRGKVWFQEALFPGYLFANCRWSESGRALLSATGVSGVVQFGTMIAELPSSVIDSLRESFGESEILTVSIAPRIGDVVEIAEGPLRGNQATIVRLLPARERIAVLLDFCGSPREIEVPILSVLGLHNPREVAAARAA